MSADNRTPWILAVYYWSPYFSLAVLEGKRSVDVVTHRLSGDDSRIQIQNFLAAMLSDYTPDRLVLEADSYPFHSAAAINFPIETISLGTVQQLLMGTARTAPYKKLYRHLVEHHPKLQRLTPTVGKNGTTADTNERRASQLLAIALGLAAHELSMDEHP